MREIVKVTQAVIHYDNGNVLEVWPNDKGRYRWVLWGRMHDFIAENRNVSGVHAAMVGAAAIHHPAWTPEQCERHVYGDQEPGGGDE